MILCVLMSMYNGTAYVIDQLDSILSQEANCEIRVLIRDDGSTDDCVRLVEDYARSRQAAVTVLRGENVGPARSFLRLIRDCPDADLYAFSDQDDVWLPGKAAAAAKCLASQQGPALWVSNYNVVDRELNLLESCPLDKPESDSAKMLFYNNVPGCVMVFNRELLLAMRSLGLSDFRMHDILALNVATITGTVLFDPRPYLLYRQHQGNVIGFSHKKIRVIRWIRDKVALLRRREDYHVTEYAAAMLKTFPEKFRDEDRARFLIISGYKKSPASCLRLLRCPFTHNGFNRTAVSIRCKILLHFF